MLRNWEDKLWLFLYPLKLKIEGGGLVWSIPTPSTYKYPPPLAGINGLRKFFRYMDFLTPPPDNKSFGRS